MAISPTKNYPSQTPEDYQAVKRALDRACERHPHPDRKAHVSQLIPN